MPQSPNRIFIDLSALEHNLQQVRKLVSSGTKIMAIVKSDAYGHGLLPVSRLLKERGVECLGVAYVQEALELRRGGIQGPITVLCGIQAREEAEEVVDKGLIPVLYDSAAIELVARESARRGKRSRIQIKVDTGMGRLGVLQKEMEALLRPLMNKEEIYVEGLCSHLSSADDPSDDFTRTQVENFNKAVRMGRSMGLELPLNSLANSAGIMAHPDAHAEMVRPGIMLYGGLPSPGFESPLPLRPVMHFRGRILQVRDLPAHTPISYGRTYYTIKGVQRIAVLSAGYGDGLPRSLSNRGKVLVGGGKRDIVGRICMNMTMCDVTGLEGVKPGSEVVFLGTQGEGAITGDEMARWAETISYEIFCAIGQKNRKEFG